MPLKMLCLTLGSAAFALAASDPAPDAAAEGVLPLSLKRAVEIVGREPTPEFAAQAFYGCVEQVLTGWIFDDEPVGQDELEQAKRLIVTTICSGLERQSGG